LLPEQGLTVEDFQQKMDELNSNKGQAGSTQSATPLPPPPSGKPTEEFVTDAASALGISSDDKWGRFFRL